jgi:Fusaric acid resistance protein-like
MSIIPARLRTIIRNWAVELRLCSRVTFAALATYALAAALHIPQVLWAVLTAIIVTQLSVGRTLKATVDYFVGTLGGAVFSSLVATLIPHQNELCEQNHLRYSAQPLLGNVTDKHFDELQPAHWTDVRLGHCIIRDATLHQLSR